MNNPVEKIDITHGDRADHLARGLKSIRDGYVIVSDDGMELAREGAISRESLRKASPDNFA